MCRLNHALGLCDAMPCPVEHSRGTCTAVPMAVDLCSTLTLWSIALMYAIGWCRALNWPCLSTCSVLSLNAINLHLIFAIDSFRETWVEYCRRQEGDSICLKLVPRIDQASIIKRWLFLLRRWMDSIRCLCSFASSYSLRLIESPSPLMGVTSDAIAWFLGVSLVLVSESWRWPWYFRLACDCGKCLVFKGLASGQAYFDELLKYILRLLAFFIGNVPAMI
jgi:hypothetical protein